jgi:plasmid stability protein
VAEIKVAGLDDAVVRALKHSAWIQGISLEEEIRRVLSEAVDRRRESLKRRMAAARLRTGTDLRPPGLDSVKIIRELRDAWG